MKNIILQHYTGIPGELEEFSITNIRSYANRIGAEYQFLEGQVFRPHLTSPCQKVFMLDETFDEYDNVVMLDIDMFVPIPLVDNIFEQPGIGLHGPVQTRLQGEIKRRHSKFANLEAPYWGGAIYKMDRKTRQHLRRWLGGDETWMDQYSRPYIFEDEGILHTLATKTAFHPKIPYLDNKWCQCSFLPNPETAGFIHVRTKVTPEGPKRLKIENYRALVEQGVIAE